jgi:hypothetical protein
LASFKGLADFTEAEFGGEANFRGMHADRIFSLKQAKFLNRVPNFEQAHFTEAPLFDETKFVAPKYNKKTNDTAEGRKIAKEEASRWRGLKRLAIQGHDHDFEMDFFAQEILALRTANRGFWGLARAFVVMVFRLLLFPFSFFIKIVFPGLFRKKSIGSRGAGADWVGCFYELFADFGRSAIRPVLWWLLSFMIFWGVFSWFIPPQPFENRTTAEIEDCRRYQQPPSEADRWQESFWLSWHNALVVGVDKEDDMKSTYCQLYGKPVPPRLVQFISVFQKIFSALMIFLFGLAIRNRLRIK